jgi:hypothetical protein
VISAKDYGYRHSSRKDQALAGLNFDISPGEKVLLLGASGSGKSTLLAAIAGVLGADEGENQGQLQVTGTVGLVLQDPDSQVIASRVGDDVAFGMENLRMPREEIWRKVPWALELVGLDLSLDHPTQRLSGGQKQRLALAGVLAMGAEIILLDEPTANLDPRGVAEVVAAVEQVTAHTNATVIIVEHRVAIWEPVVQRCLVLGTHGEILADGGITEVVQHHGKQLAAAGIWLPGLDPDVTPAKQHQLGRQGVLKIQHGAIGWQHQLPLYPLDLGFPVGSSTVITGDNGAGKSTLLMSLAGLLPLQAGSVTVSEQIARGLSVHPQAWKSKELAQRMGYVFQDPEHQFVAPTVGEEMLVGVSNDQQDRAWEILDRLQLLTLVKANPFTLSGGQKRRLSVATALLRNPDIVFFDEPTFGQDRTTFLELLQLLRELTDNGTTVISVTHDEIFRVAMADYHYHLGGGDA